MEQLNKIATDLHDIIKTGKFVGESLDCTALDCTAIDEMLEDSEFRIKLQLFLDISRFLDITLEHTIGHLIFRAYRCGREAANTNKDKEKV